MNETIYDSEVARLRPGAPPSVTRDEPVRLQPAAGPHAPDIVHWAPIIAGFLIAVGTFVLLSLLLLALGASAVRVGDVVDDPGDGIATATAVAGLVSFLIGGFLAARLANVRETWSGLLVGFLVWALGLILILILAALGLGQLFGEAGTLLGRFGALRDDLPAGVTGDDVARAVRDSALPAFLSLALPAASAALGGLIGAQDDLGFGVRRRADGRPAAPRPGTARADARR